VHKVAPGESLANLLSQGALDAAFTGIAGIGRSGPPDANWQDSASEAPTYRELLPDAPSQEKEWYERTGVLPLHSLVVVKDELLSANPWIAESLYRAFVESKELYLRQLPSLPIHDKDSQEHLANAAVVQGDPLPYGFEDNRNAIETLARYAREQSLISTLPDLSSLFCAVG
jgi:4,5-dihydroxyphthalate decarboxylase